jgi:hypothetical protein
MTGNNTGSTSAIRRAELYSDFILETIHDQGLPEGAHRDVSDFGDGDTLNIPTFGEVIIRDLDPENESLPIDKVDNGKITLTINQFKGGGTAFTDQMREDNYTAQAFDAYVMREYMTAIKEAYETDLLNQQAKQASADINSYNDVAHRFCASGGSGARTLTLDDIIYTKLAFDRAHLPDMGRIMVVSPVNEASINSISNLVSVSNNPMFEGIVETGFGKNMRFIKNIYGFDIFVSNRLPTLSATEALDTTASGIAAPSGNDTAEVGDTIVQAWCAADDQVTPIMGAWRRQPRVRGERNEKDEQDEFYFSARWGFGLQRPQSMVSIATSSTAY